MRLTNLLLAGTATLFVGCGDDTTSSPDLASSAKDMSAQSLYDKYGGAPTVVKVVDDAVAGLLADCTQAPYFAGVNTAAKVSKLKGCLVLQFTVLLGGPGTYPGKNANGDTCSDMKTIHTGLGIPSAVFDQFVADLVGVLKKDGVTDADIATLAPTVLGYKSDIVAATPILHNACVDGGT